MVKQAARRQPKEAKGAANRSFEGRPGTARLAIYIFSAAAIFAAAPVQAMETGGNYSRSLKSSRFHQSGNAAFSRQSAAPAAKASAGAELVPAAFSGLARRLPAGIYPESSSVVTYCFNARMIALLTTIQRKYRRPLIITSGYRGPAHNISAGGVRGSLHTACAAADIKIPGVNKYQLAGYVRSLPQRGGVGLYCHNAVHVDIGSPREWNWCATGRPQSAHKRLQRAHKHKSRSRHIRRPY